MKQFRAMPKQHQQMMMQQQAMARQQATTQQRDLHVAPGGPGMPAAAAAPSAAQPSLYRGNPGGYEPTGMTHPSGLAGEVSKGIGKLMTKLGTAPNVKSPPKGYVGMAGGGFTIPGSFSAKDLKPKKKKEPSSSSSGDGSKGDRHDTTVKLFNGIVKSSLNLVGLG